LNLSIKLVGEFAKCWFTAHLIIKGGLLGWRIGLLSFGGLLTTLVLGGMLGLNGIQASLIVTGNLRGLFRPPWFQHGNVCPWPRLELRQFRHLMLIGQL